MLANCKLFKKKNQNIHDSKQQAVYDFENLTQMFCRNLLHNTCYYTCVELLFSALCFVRSTWLKFIDRAC